MLQPVHDVSARRRVQQMRRRRMPTLKDMLYRYSAECYSRVDLVGAEYSLPSNTAGQARKPVVKYFTISFTPKQMPDRERSSLQRMRVYLFSTIPERSGYPPVGQTTMESYQNSLAWGHTEPSVQQSRKYVEARSTPAPISTLLTRPTLIGVNADTDQYRTARTVRTSKLNRRTTLDAGRQVPMHSQT
ncbi:predicted protein [Coccidioides posadasii str. Silveira]|uniref:Predicted protein n=1 Tax=Coccidioides posadasii (strain RMSCC 757 / Silveira) TaxID=443226 RepID=E9DH04_COCPS|nr:predicted protein [Coccidioides posadasii str. Silveira]